MADNTTGLNRQYEDPPFSMSAAIGSTGAPGSAGIGPTETDEPLAEVMIINNFESTQAELAEPAELVPVGVGDSAGGSDDLGAHVGPAGGSADRYMRTGAGEGRVIAGDLASHPNAGR